MPAVRTSSARPRQDPVSCQLCRVKKLKCDRQRPCSNCKSRRLACEYQGEVARSDPAATESPEYNQDELQSVKSRLQKLENAVFGDLRQTTDFREQNHSSLPTVVSTAPSTPSGTGIDGDKADEDSNWLEAIGTRSDVVLPQFTDPFTINLHTLEQTLNAAQNSTQVRSVDMPTYEVAIASLNAYSVHLDAVQHIMHVESTHQMIDTLYSQIYSRQMVDPGALAFVLALCANVGFYWTIGFHRGTALFPDDETAKRVSTEWTRQAVIAIEQARVGTTTTSLEAVQGSIMIMFLFYHMEGFTFRVRMFHASAIAMSRDLGIHKTDMPGFRSPPTSRADIIDVEVRRKLWWHLTCTDWFLSFLGGPHEGMYSIHLKHMCVSPPRNITRDDLNTKGPEFQRSLSEPTIMAYYLQRIKLGTICREVADSFYNFARPEQVDYDVVRTLDDKFETQMQELPRFLRFDIPSKQLRAEYGDAYDQQCDVQGVMINLMLNTRRCRLHLPFLIRAKTNPRFSFSRRIGLQAARAVFNVRRAVIEDANAVMAGHLKLGGMVQHIFFATVVFVMDLCVNKEHNDQSQIMEVREALQVMENAKNSSQMGSRFHDSLMAVLTKHRVKLSNTSIQTNGPELVPPQTIPTPSDFYPLQQTPHSVYQTPSNANNGFPEGVCAATTPLPYNPLLGVESSEIALDTDMWQDFLEQGGSLAPQDWDALLGDLNERLLN